MSRTAVVALGGNAFTAAGQAGSYDEQQANAVPMAACIAELVTDGWRIVVVHGNGPQVGNLSIQQAAGDDQVPAQPLSVLGAMTQGQLGSLVVTAVRAATRGAQPVTAVLTHAVVDPHDPAFGHPTKPIGPFYDPAEARSLATEHGWEIAEDAGRGWRRVVASPEPVDFLELAAVRTLLGAGHVVVTAGGGGIPVVAGDGPGQEVGTDAVVDKDYAAAAIALALQAQALVLVTGVDAVRLDFGLPTERRVTRLSATEAQHHLTDGQFPAGSMGPKMRAALRFVDGGGGVAVVTTAELAAATLRGDAGDTATGTRIEPAVAVLAQARP